MNIQNLLDLGLSRIDAEELRRLGIKLIHQAEICQQTDAALSDEFLDTDPVTEADKKYFRLLDRMNGIIGRYPDLHIAEANSGGYAVGRTSEALAALESGGAEACMRVPVVELNWR